MDKAASRSEPRVLYRAPVWLRSTEDGRSLVGETRNLSRRGMFVSIAPVPELGTELLCELPGRPAMKGRVAWVFEAQTPDTQDLTGVGIEIVDLTENAPSIVEELVGVRLDDRQPLEIRFDGLPSPIRATGRVTHEGIDLSTSLGFLKIGSEVSVGTPQDRGHSLRGRISRVLLRTDDGAPRLQISLAVLPERAPVSLPADDERWFPEITVEEQSDSLPFEPTPLVVAPEAIVDPEPTLRTEPPAPTPLPPRAAGPAVRPVFLAGALCAVALTVAARALPQDRIELAPPGQEARVEVITVPTVVEAPAVAEAPAAAEPASAPELNAHARPVASAEHPTVEPDAAPAPTPAPAAAPASATQWKPTIAGGAIVVPVSGSTRGRSTFTMSDPPGVAIDLPHARTDVPMRSYLLHDEALRSLWVRARPAGGLQIRLHVAPGVRMRVDASEGTVRFRRSDP